MAQPPDQPGRRKRAIVAGYGPVGRIVAEQLFQAGMAVTIVETNQSTIQKQVGLGMDVCYGDITNPAVLVKAGLAAADALVVTIPNEEAAVKAVIAARKLSSEIFIAVRTNFVSQGMAAKQAGADQVFVEEIVTAEAMRGAVLRHLQKDNP